MLDGCVAFDVQVNTQCALRFASKDAALASPNPSGYWNWWQGSCENNCATNYVGRGGIKGRCWVKRKGSFYSNNQAKYFREEIPPFLSIES